MAGKRGRSGDEGGKQTDINGSMVATRIQGALCAWAILLLGARSWSKALRQLSGPVLMSVAPVPTEDCAEACDLGCHLGTCWYPRACCHRGHGNLNSLP